MARNFIKRIQDNFQYDKKMYNEFVKRYGFTLPKFLFTRSYLNIFYDKNEDVVFERLSKLKDFSDVEIEKILKLMEEYPKLVKSPNYRWWLNDRNISLFIANYELNFDLINKILELDLVDLYIKFKDIFSYEKFINFVEKFDYDKSILDRLSIEDIKNNKVLNLVDLYKEKLPNEKEIIKLYNSNYIFRDFYDYYIEIDKNLLFIALENCHDLKDIDKVYNYMKILKFIPEMYDRLREIQPDLEFVLINMINNADYYQIMLEFRNERNALADVLESFELSKKIFKNNDQFFNFIALQLENCNTLNSLKAIFKITFPESLNLIEYDVNYHALKCMACLGTESTFSE